MHIHKLRDIYCYIYREQEGQAPAAIVLIKGINSTNLQCNQKLTMVCIAINGVPEAGDLVWRGVALAIPRFCCKTP